MNYLEKHYTNEFFKIYYKKGIWRQTPWLGVMTLKCPFDLWIYQEILYETKPDWIIECGTFIGGSSLFLASMCDLIDHGKIITIDILDYKPKKTHPRITYLHGSSTSKEIEEKVKSMISEDETVMVILDSAHSKAHVLNELNIYSKLVTPGNYLIVEDTCVNAHPQMPYFGNGPLEAVLQFLTGNDRFIVDRAREKFLLTFNPSGYLKRVK
ncbi:CmcI family methyltransferase [Bacillus benzoevorans]|uniref:Cephalosporin hydroxylase n=1 Tax=Bacillus benzoevorans TaxID=1456 RepID=A0A7X0HSY7_9BACI|nr:CmcI family methyltransferase [Bacillus benzoevorans]MBB6445160.1 cephalosporin hydroxylase [Bacillus benzoevorans]